MKTKTTEKKKGKKEEEALAESFVVAHSALPFIHSLDYMKGPNKDIPIINC